MIVATCTHPRCFQPRPCPTHAGDNNAAFYNSRTWRNNRKRFIDQHPLCAACGLAGRITLAAEVDHVRPIRAGGDRLAWSNLQALCKSCHSTKTRRESSS